MDQDFHIPAFILGAGAIFGGFLLTSMGIPMAGGLPLLMGMGSITNAMVSLCVRAYGKVQSPLTKYAMVMAAAMIFMITGYLIIQITIIGMMALNS